MHLNIAMIDGDGVGREMMDATRAVLNAVCAVFGHTLEAETVIACGDAIDAGLGPLPEDSLARCQAAQAVLFGNTGLRKYRNAPLHLRPEMALMHLRKGLGVTTNLRPVKAYPELAGFSPLKPELLGQGIDIVFVRDILGGILTSEKVKGRGDQGREAFEYEYYNETIVEKTAEIAFALARQRKKQVISLDKANVLGSSKLWRKTVEGVAAQYPEIGLRHLYIDQAAMRIMARPQDFDVVVTANLFGDIISDEGTQLTGTPYLYGSAEISRGGPGLYTPNQLHHPDESIIGKNLVNPIGMIAAMALMLRFSFGLEKEAQAVERAISDIIAEGYVTQDIWRPGKVKISTNEMGSKIATLVSE